MNESGENLLSFCVMNELIVMIHCLRRPIF